MKKLVMIPVLMALSVSAFGSDFDDVANVRRVIPVVEQVNNPRQECYTDYVSERGPRPSERGIAGAVVGGIAGAILGNQVGHGNGRTAATAVGAATGAIVGDRVQNADNDRRGRWDDDDERPVRRCRQVDHWENQTTGYRVVYEYMGRKETTVLPYDPGSTLRVHVSVTPDQR
jgi:uncharacterized protein YcfJ